jgi:hypothetical protein
MNPGSELRHAMVSFREGPVLFEKDFVICVRFDPLSRTPTPLCRLVPRKTSRCEGALRFRDLLSELAMCEFLMGIYCTD